MNVIQATASLDDNTDRVKDNIFIVPGYEHNDIALLA
jgi:hypothetical protein